MSNFAMPALQLQQQGAPLVAQQPTGGQAFALNPDGTIPSQLLPAKTTADLTYVTFTTTVGVVSNTESAGNLVVTANAITADGVSSYWVEFFSPFVQSPASAGNGTIICLFEGATEIGRMGSVIAPTAASVYAPILSKVQLTPTAGSHTYKITAFCSAGSGNVGGQTGSTGLYVAGYIRIYKA